MLAAFIGALLGSIVGASVTSWFNVRGALKKFIDELQQRL